MSHHEANPALDEMRQRNGAHWRDKQEFEALRDTFCREQGITQEELARQLAAGEVQPTDAWRTAYFSTMSVWCGDCEAYHKPTAEHPRCGLCSHVHAPMPEGLYFDYRGWKFTPPFICMGCGIEVCFRQWAFSRSCGPCDVSHSRTRRISGRQAFVGPHERLTTWDATKHDLDESGFIDPATRENHRLINRPRPRRPIR